MGGTVPLGYDSEDRKLVVNEEEAKTARHTLRRYAKFGSVLALKEALDAQGVAGKTRGVWRGGAPRSRETI